MSAYPIAPHDCVHARLHPGRVDGSRTVCFGCGSMVHVDAAYYASGEPLLFKVDSDPVIQGWHDGIRGMQIGGRRKITIPAELAYGSKGIKDPARNRWVVPPRATLYFR